MASQIISVSRETLEELQRVVDNLLNENVYIVMRNLSINELETIGKYNLDNLKKKIDSLL